MRKTGFVLPHNWYYVVFLFSPFSFSHLQYCHAVKLSLIDLSCIGGIDSGYIQAAVPQNISKACQVLRRLIINSCKQVPEIVRKYFLPADTCFLFQRFHLAPEITPVFRLPAFRYENTARPNFSGWRKHQKFFSDAGCQEDSPVFSFVVYFDPPLFYLSGI